jgi:hypothetical protein
MKQAKPPVTPTVFTRSAFRRARCLSCYRAHNSVMGTLFKGVLSTATEENFGVRERK